MIQMIVVPYGFSAEEIDTSAPSWTQPIDYLALGDSLAAGVTPNNELGKGYADFLAESIHGIGALKSYNKGFSYPGYKTTDVLNDIKLNVTKDIQGIGFEEKTAKLQQSIKDAEVITISVGANDILPLLKQVPATGKTSIDQQMALAILQQVGTNYKSIMAQINEINPDAQVYVMGYYNPYPYMSEDMQPLLKQLLDMMNKAIATGLVGTQAVLVPTGDVIASDYKTYLPNPENIHLSEAGYKKVTEQFWTNMRTANPGIEAGSPVADPTIPTVFTDIGNHGLKSYIEQAAAARIIGGYADGTFKPDQNLTRVQAISIIVSALGLKTEEVAPFGDIGNYADKTQSLEVLHQTRFLTHHSARPLKQVSQIFRHILGK